MAGDRGVPVRVAGLRGRAPGGGPGRLPAAAGLAVQAEQAVQQAAGIEAASRERERIARGIHDSVLQVLALVHRRGMEAGGEAAELGRLAGEQEAALRALIASGRAGPLPPGQLDLCTLLNGEGSADVSVVTPAGPVRLASGAAQETTLAVRAAGGARSGAAIVMY